MLLIILFIILLLIVAGGVLTAVMGPRHMKRPGVFTAIAAAVVLIITFFATSFTSIGANEIGIQTTFGAPSKEVLKPGPQLVAPWSDVERFSTRVQVLDMSNKDGTDSPTVAIKFSGNSGGNVSTVTRWRIENDDQAVELWRNYRTFATVQDQLVAGSVRDALNKVFANYTPEDGVNGNNRDKINAAVVAELNKVLDPNGIKVDSISLAGIDPDPATQARIDRQVQRLADIETAKLEQDKARIDNETNALRTASLTPAALQQRCLDILADAVEKKSALPPTLNCGFGAGAVTNLPVG